MAGSGPPPSDNARRRNSRPSSAILPVEGRQGDAPEWPLRTEIGPRVQLELLAEREIKLRDEWAAAANARTARALAQRLETVEAERRTLDLTIEAQEFAEAELWAEIWRTPQAVQWEAVGWTREVAQYVRWKVRAEDGDLKAATEARQMADRLGLNPLFMMRLGWSIGNPAKVDADDLGDNVVELFG